MLYLNTKKLFFIINVVADRIYYLLSLIVILYLLFKLIFFNDQFGINMNYISLFSSLVINI